MKLWSFIKDREPAMIAAMVQAGLALVVAFGVDLSAEQLAALVAVSAALFGLLTRQAVVPTAKVPVPIVPPLERVIGDVSDLVTNPVQPAGGLLENLPVLGRILGRKT